MKVCLECKLNKQIIEFSTSKICKDGYRNQCKVCRNTQRNKRPKIEYLPSNINEHSCNYCKQTKSIENFNKHTRRKSGYCNICRECQSIKNKMLYEKNYEVIKEKVKDYIVNNREKVRETKRKYSSKKRKTDILYKLKRNLRNRLYYALKAKSWKKDTHFAEYIGCSLEYLKEHIEKQFKPGMSWDNYGMWQIDHHLALFHGNTEEELYKLCHYTNLKPLWQSENASKQHRIIN